MARGQRDLLGPRPLVRRKRYLYITRPLVAWLLLRERRWPPPMAMPELLAGASLPHPVLRAIESLIAEKQAGVELGEGPRIAVLDDWMRTTLDQADPAHLPDTAQAPDNAAVQRFFLTELGLADRAHAV
jgi:predicted nucleotidyltransferase